MRPTIPAALLLLAAAGCSQSAPQDPDTLARWKDTSFFELESRTLEGQALPFRSLDGGPVLVVNVASECGYTPQYEGLQALHERYAARGLTVLGFPCNQFLGQEPGSPAEIRAFCSEEFGVGFPLMEKVEVKAGEGQSPVYGFLGTRSGELPAWNFAKYLVSRDGRTVRFFGTRVAPDDPELIAAVEAALGP